MSIRKQDGTNLESLVLKRMRTGGEEVLRPGYLIQLLQLVKRSHQALRLIRQ